LLPNGVDVQDYLHLNQFLHAVVVALVITVIILIHSMVAIFSLHMYAQQMLFALLQVFSTSLHAYVEWGWNVGVSR